MENCLHDDLLGSSRKVRARIHGPRELKNLHLQYLLEQALKELRAARSTELESRSVAMVVSSSKRRQATLQHDHSLPLKDKRRDPRYPLCLINPHFLINVALILVALENCLGFGAIQSRLFGCIRKD